MKRSAKEEGLLHALRLFANVGYDGVTVRSRQGSMPRNP